MDTRDLLSAASIRAAAGLLTDCDDNVVAACRRRLLDWGEASRPTLEEATRCDDARLRIRARSLLRALDVRSWTEEFRRFGARISDARKSEDTLEAGVLAISAFDRRDFDRAGTLRRVEDIATALRPRVAGRAAVTAARHLAQVLGEELAIGGVRGDHYYRPEHLHLDHVLAGRSGVPASLAALYLLVGRRAGLTVTAVQLPEYFLVRVHGRRPVLLDPFHDGRSVTKGDCRRYLRGTGTDVRASVRLADVDDIDVLLGMLSGLARVHDRSDDFETYRAIQTARLSLSAL